MRLEGDAVRPLAGQPWQKGAGVPAKAGGALPPFPSGGLAVPGAPAEAVGAGTGAATAPGMDRILSALNLPKDALSLQLVNFARFFSLPLDPGLLARIRREALALPGPREALLLALLAAEAKGVRLGPEALAHYAAAIDPRRRSGGHPAAGDASSPAAPDTAAPEVPETGVFPQLADFLHRALDGALRQDSGEAWDDPAAILNRLPGKNGARWEVYPFRFSAGDVEIGVSVRLLCIEGADFAGGGPEERRSSVRRLAVDLHAGHPGTDARAAPGGGCSWLFLMDGQGIFMRIFRDPPPGERERAALEREARRLLGDLAGRISVEAAPAAFFADALEPGIFRVDEAV